MVLAHFFNLKDVYLQNNINSFRHLKLEIVLAIPASNDEKNMYTFYHNTVETIQQDQGYIFRSAGCKSMHSRTQGLCDC